MGVVLALQTCEILERLDLSSHLSAQADLPKKESTVATLTNGESMAASSSLGAKKLPHLYVEACVDVESTELWQSREVGNALPKKINVKTHSGSFLKQLLRGSIGIFLR